MVPFPRLDRYTLLRSLAVGGMGEVFLARQRSAFESFDRLVAVKLLLRSYSEDKDFVRMFLNEASLAAKLSHPSVVQVYDLGHDQGYYYLVMEYLAGESLQRVVASLHKNGQRIPPRIAC